MVLVVTKPKEAFSPEEICKLIFSESLVFARFYFTMQKRASQSSIAQPILEFTCKELYTNEGINITYEQLNKFATSSEYLSIVDGVYYLH